MKKLTLVFFSILFLVNIGYSQKINIEKYNKDIILSNFMQLSLQQLYDTAHHYLFKNSMDTALICYGLMMKTPEKIADTKQQELLIDAYIKVSHIYSNMCDYLTAYRYLIDALLFSEKYQIQHLNPIIYNNLGNIYTHFYQYGMAKSYYWKAINLCTDTTSLDVVYNNLGNIEYYTGNRDSALYFLDKSIQICKTFNIKNLAIALDSKGSLYQDIKLYDSAFHYYHLSLSETKTNIKFNDNLTEAYTLSHLGNLFFEVGQTDSAIFYITLSNHIAIENNYLQILSDNYLVLSQIDESKGKTKSALEYHKKYAHLKDSVSSAEIFGDIHRLQRYYEVSKTNQQIEELVFEQKIKERTIHLQRILWISTFVVLLLVSAGLLYIYIQKRSLNKAYKVLFEKNIEIIELQDSSPEKQNKKGKPVILNDERQNELAERILRIMEDVSTICDTDFSLAKLAVLLQSNHVYISQVINNAFKKNFRLLLGSYRIKEAQRLFSAPDATKYTIESVANTVGFKSANAFRSAFKESTGVSPGYYLNSMMKRNIHTVENINTA